MKLTSWCWAGIVCRTSRPRRSTGLGPNSTRRRLFHKCCSDGGGPEPGLCPSPRTAVATGDRSETLQHRLFYLTDLLNIYSALVNAAKGYIIIRGFTETLLFNKQNVFGMKLFAFARYNVYLNDNCRYLTVTADFGTFLMKS